MTFVEIGLLIILIAACLCGILILWGNEMRSIKRMEMQTWWMTGKSTKPTNGGSREL